MAEIKWTCEQTAAIEERGRNVLVSAAAGSGKTAVLVERVLRRLKDTENSVDIDSFVIMTFTKAAASQMKDKIHSQLRAMLEGDPENEHLKRQLQRIHGARICTIDSLCADIVRENFQTVDIDPGFRIADESESVILRDEVLKDLIEECYADPSDGFLKFVNFYIDKSDSKLEDIILTLHEFSQSHPEPAKWIADCSAPYVKAAQLGAGYTEDELRWFENLASQIKLEIKNAANLAAAGLGICLSEGGPDKYAPRFEEAAAMLSSLSGDDVTFDFMRDTILEFLERWGALSPIRKGEEVSSELKEAAKQLRDDLKASLVKLRENYFKYSLEEAYENMAGCADVVLAISGMTNEFSKRYLEAKKERGIAEFGDVAHFALRVLIQHNEDGIIRRDEDGNCLYTAAADRMAEEITEIIVDEYQDTNMLQEYIINALSAERFGRPDVFMVGDVKQSIYGFRMACPELFARKFYEYSSPSPTHVRVLLNTNFRSVKSVLDLTNKVFSRSMIRDIGNIDYTDGHELVHPDFARKERGGAEGNGGAEELGIIGENDGDEEGGGAEEYGYDEERGGAGRNDDSEERDGAGENGGDEECGDADGHGDDEWRGGAWENDGVEERGGAGENDGIEERGNAGENGGDEERGGAGRNDDSEELPEIIFIDEGGSEGRVQEACLVARRIEELVENGRVKDEKTGTLRPVSYKDIAILSRGNDNPEIESALSMRAIPFVRTSGKGFFEAFEIKLLTNLLQIIDNPYQDIPFTAVITSPVVGLSSEDIAKIKIHARGRNLKGAPDTAQGAGLPKEANTSAGPGAPDAAQSADLPSGEALQPDSAAGSAGDSLIRESSPPGSAAGSAGDSLIRESSPPDSAAGSAGDSLIRESSPPDSAAGSAGDSLIRESSPPGSAAGSARICAAVSMYEMCLDYDGNPDLSDFLRKFEEYRKAAGYMNVSELLDYILDDSAYCGIISAMKGGQFRLANIEFFRKKAFDYSNSSYAGLFNFTRYLKQMENSGVDYAKVPAAEGGIQAVRIMSIHAAKGLEFPVVFLVRAGREYNMTDIYKAIVPDRELGIGIELRDPVERTVKPTLLMETIKEAVKQDLVAEEMRLLYVAMTRAKEKLIITGSARNLAAMADKWEAERYRTPAPCGGTSRQPGDIGGRAEEVGSSVTAPCGGASRQPGGIGGRAEESGSPVTAPCGGASRQPGGIGGRAEESGSPAPAPLGAGSIMASTSFMKVLGRSLYSRSGGEINIISPDENERERLGEIMSLAQVEDKIRSVVSEARSYEERLKDIKSQIDFRYRYESATVKPLKVAASQLENHDIGGASAGSGDSSEAVIPEGERASAKNGAQAAAPGNKAGGESNAFENSEPDRRRSGQGAAAPGREEASAQAAAPDREELFGAERGNAYHKFFELLKYELFEADKLNEAAKENSEGRDVLDEIRHTIVEMKFSLLEEGLIEEAYARTVDPDKIAAFLTSTVGRRMKAAADEGTLRREQQFVMSCTDPEGEERLVQGIIDAFFIENGEAVIVDYKTDRGKTDEEFVLTYSAQVDIYARALGSAAQIPVKEKIIYSVELGREIIVP